MREGLRLARCVCGGFDIGWGGGVGCFSFWLGHYLGCEYAETQFC
jgi:hypothetical protein